MIELHLLTASGGLAPLADALMRVVSTTGEVACSLLGISEPVDVVVRDAAGAPVIREIGMRGTTASAHEVFVSLAPHAFDGTGYQFGRVLAHELHHVARRRAGATGSTLLDAFVHEGLADHFVDEFIGGAPSPWCCAVDRSECNAALARAAKDFDSASVDRRAWMFGAVDQGLPRWVGYTIGYNLVADYLASNHEATAAGLAGARSELFRPQQ